MIIKEHPEDFRVEERIDLVWDLEPGPFRLYTLEKRSWNTTDAFQAAARATGIPWGVIRYGGKKDRQACTVQYGTTPAAFDLSFQRHNVRVTPVGFAPTPMGPRHVKGNKFDVVMRRVEKGHGELLGQRWEEMERHGELNYFDDQRFGGVSSSGAFFAEFVVRKDFSGALRHHMTSHHPEASPAIRRRKRSMDRMWGDWRALRSLAVTPEEREMVGCCLANPGERGILEALGLLSRETWGLYLSSFQSALWNEALALMVRRSSEPLWSLRGKVTSLPFFRHKGTEGAWRSLEIPMPSSELSRSDDEGSRAVGELLKRHGLKPEDFILTPSFRAHFSYFSRSAVVVPQEGTWGLSDDDRHRGYDKGRVSFFLPAGSYATLILRSLQHSIPGPSSDGPGPG